MYTVFTTATDGDQSRGTYGPFETHQQAELCIMELAKRINIRASYIFSHDIPIKPIPHLDLPKGAN